MRISQSALGICLSLSAVAAACDGGGADVLSGASDGGGDDALDGTTLVDSETIFATDAGERLVVGADAALQVDADAALDATSKAPPIVSGSVYEIIGKQSGKCLEDTDFGLSDGILIRQWGCNGFSAQRWRIDDVGGDLFTLTVESSGKVMDVDGASLADGALVHQWASANTDNQKWQLVDLGGGAFKIVSKMSGKCLDMTNFSTHDGTFAQQYACTGADNQIWQLQKLGALPPINHVSYTNPVIDSDFPDPGILHLSDGNYYAYATQDPWGHVGTAKSKDLVHWQNMGDSLPELPSFAPTRAWAPQVVQDGDTYYLYYAGNYPMCSIVATASSPVGPFIGVKALVCDTDFQAIDPMAFDDVCDKFTGVEQLCVHVSACAIKGVLSGLNEQMNLYLKKFTLADLVPQAIGAGYVPKHP